MEEINSLPFDDVEEAIKQIEYIRRKKREMKVLFIVTSVIAASDRELNYSKTRSIYSQEERIKQTKQTVASIREMAPGSAVWVVEGGIQDYGETVDLGCDRYIYVGDKPKVRKAVDSKRKGVGEAEMLLAVIDEIRDFPFVFKISGRYRLNHQFRIDDFDFERCNFKNYTGKDSFYIGESKYIKGSHSTRLYGIPLKHLDMWEKALRRSVLSMKLRGAGIENVMCRYFHGDVMFYHDCLGIEGNVAVNGEKIEE